MEIEYLLFPLLAVISILHIGLANLLFITDEDEEAVRLLDKIVDIVQQSIGKPAPKQATPQPQNFKITIPIAKVVRR